MAICMDSGVPQFDSDDLRGTVKKLHDYTISLSEQLRFLLANLDSENIPAIEVLNQAVQDAKGNLAELTLTAQGLQSRVESAEGSISQVQQTAEGLVSRVENAEGGLSAVTQTAEGLRSRVQDAEGSLVDLVQTANGLTSRVSDAEGNVSRISQTAQGLESRVSDLNGKYTSIRQTVDSIDVEGTVNSVMQDGVAELNFLDGRENIGFIRSTSNGVLNIGSKYDIQLSPGDRLIVNGDTTMYGALRVFLTPHRYWEFAADGIHYFNESGESVTMMKEK